VTEAVTGVLLVGGASSRFGSPKALATFRGKTLAAHAWNTLEWCDERLAVGKVADGLPLPFPLADDGTDVRAPIAGLAAGLRAARHDLCVVLPVDVPLVGERELRVLASLCCSNTKLAAAVPQTGPLPGAYRRGTLPALEAALAAGDLSIRDVLAGLETAVLALDPAALANVNSPQDLPV
jgi:molybdopterin-guanine dinucleotide biosynthesis protein A